MYVFPLEMLPTFRASSSGPICGEAGASAKVAGPLDGLTLHVSRPQITYFKRVEP